MSKFNVSTLIHMLLGSLPCLHLDLYAFRLLAMFTLRSACLCSLSCLRLDLHAYVFFVMFTLRSTCHRVENLSCIGRKSWLCLFFVTYRPSISYVHQFFSLTSACS